MDILVVSPFGLLALLHHRYRLRLLRSQAISVPEDVISIINQ